MHFLSVLTGLFFCFFLRGDGFLDRDTHRFGVSTS